MDHLAWRFAALLSALVSTTALTGASLYEESGLAAQTRHRPGDRRRREPKTLWIPADLIAILCLAAAIWAAWSDSGTRNAVLVAVGLYAITIAVSAVYFVPELLKVEKLGAGPSRMQAKRLTRLAPAAKEA